MLESLRRHIMMQQGGSSSRLPDWLKEVAGISVTVYDNDNTAYIRIDKNLDATLGIKCNTLVNDAMFGYLFSCEYKYKTKAIVFSPGSNGSLIYDTNFNPAFNYSSKDEYLHTRVIKINYKNDQRVVAEIDGYATRDVALPSIQYYKAVSYFYLFAYTGNGSFRTVGNVILIGEIELTEGTEVTHILVPSMVKSNHEGFVAGEYGYYDLMDETFHNFTIVGSPTIEILT